MKGVTAFQTFLMFLVLSAVTFLLMCTAIAKYIDPDSSLQSYNQLLKRIDAMAEDPRIIADSMMLELSKGGGVLVFQKDVEYVAVKYAVPITPPLSPHGYILIAERPSKCENSVCICYAEKFESELLTADKYVGPHFPPLVEQVILLNPVQKIFCRNLDAKLYLNFYQCTDQIKKNCYKKDNLQVSKRIDGKLIISREEGNVETGLILLRNIKMPDTRTIEPEKRIPIALEQYGGYINIGFHTPLFTPWDKKKIDFYNLADRLVDCANTIYCEISADEIKHFMPSESSDTSPTSLIEFVYDYNMLVTLKHNIGKEQFEERISLRSGQTPIMWKQGVWDVVKGAIDTRRPLADLNKFELQGTFNRVILKVGNDLYSVKYIGAEPLVLDFHGPYTQDDAEGHLPRSLVIYVSPFRAPAVPTPGTGGSLPGPHDPHLPPDI